MDRVVSAQRVPFRELSGVAGKRFVDADDAQLGVDILQRIEREAVGLEVDATTAAGGRHRCPRFGIHQLAGCHDVGAIPELRGVIGAGLVEDKLDQRGGVELDDQRR